MAEKTYPPLNEVEIEIVEEDRYDGRIIRKKRAAVKGKQPPPTLLKYAKEALEIE